MPAELEPPLEAVARRGAPTDENGTIDLPARSVRSLHPDRHSAMIPPCDDDTFSFEVDQSRVRDALPRLRAIGASLAATGVVVLVGRYEGSGDEGMLTELTALGATGELLDVKVEYEVWDLLDSFVPLDFQDGPGGRGEVRYEIASGQVVTNHQQVVEAWTSYTRAFPSTTVAR